MKEYSRTKNSTLNLVTGLGGQLVLTLLHFVSRTVFIHVLGSVYLGIGGLFLNVLSFLSLSELGLGSSIVYKLYKPLAEKDEKRVRVLMKFYKQAYIVIGISILLLGMAMIPSLPLIIKDYDTLPALGINPVIVFMLYLLQSVTSYLFFAYRTVIIKTAQKLYVLNVVDFFINVVIIIIQIIVLLCFEDYMTYLAVVILFNFVKNAINAVIAHRMFPYAFKREKESISRKEAIGVFKDCGALFIFKISGVALKATDNIVLSAFIGLSIVGLYANYLLFYNTIKRLINHFYRSIKHSMGNAYATASLKKNYFIFETVNFMTILLNGTAGVLVAICANETIEVWVGKDYVIPQPFPILMGIEMLFTGLKINLGQVRNISGAFRQAWFRPAIGVIINVVVSIVLCQKIGICGVIIGTIVSDILSNFIIDPFIIHRVSFKGYKPASYYYRKNLIFIILLFMIGAVDYLICSQIVLNIKILSLILHIIVCFVSVPVTFYLIYREGDVCQYLYGKMGTTMAKIHKKLKKS